MDCVGTCFPILLGRAWRCQGGWLLDYYVGEFGGGSVDGWAGNGLRRSSRRTDGTCSGYQDMLVSVSRWLRNEVVLVHSVRVVPDGQEGSCRNAVEASRKSYGGSEASRICQLWRFKLSCSFQFCTPICSLLIRPDGLWKNSRTDSVINQFRPSDVVG